MSAAQQPTRAESPRRQRLDKKNVVGLPQLRFVQSLIGKLRSAHDHPNRRLFLDDAFIGLLLAFFNPVIRSLRGIEDASQMPGINQHLNVEAIRRSTLADGLATFDPQLLVPLIAHLHQQATPPQLDATDPTLRGMLNRLLAFDGSYFRTAGDVTWALRERHGPNGKLRRRVRLDLHLSVADGRAQGVRLSGAGDAGEPAALLEAVEAGQIVVADRGCFSHATVHELIDRQVDFVLRLQRRVKCQVIAERPLSDADRQAGVISDQTVLLTGSKNDGPRVPLRRVTIAPTGDASRHGEASAHTPPSPIVLLTSVQDESVAAWMIGHLYRRRWEIELFFRWLKCCAGCDHLLGESRNGMLMQLYVALIGTLLLAVCTGRPPDRYSFNLMCLAAAGQGSIDDALAILARRHAERDRDRQRRAQRQAQRER